jgi:hypothetical protein
MSRRGVFQSRDCLAFRVVTRGLPPGLVSLGNVLTHGFCTALCVATRSRARCPCPRARAHWCTTSPMTAADRTRAARARSPSTASRSVKAASRKPWERSIPWLETPLTSAWTRNARDGRLRPLGQCVHRHDQYGEGAAQKLSIEGHSLPASDGQLTKVVADCHWPLTCRIHILPLRSSVACQAEAYRVRPAYVHTGGKEVMAGFEGVLLDRYIQTGTKHFSRYHWEIRTPFGVLSLHAFSFHSFLNNRGGNAY